MEILKKYKGYIILGLGILGLIAMNFDDLKADFFNPAEEYSEILVNTEATTDETEYIIVEIKGEVVYPGIYQVDKNLRVGDVLNIAGGVTTKADTSEVNQASKIYDEMIILIPKTEVVTTQIEIIDIVRIVVEIKGGVVNPGVYNLYKNSRVYDLVEAAGGLLENADTTTIDMARLLIDGESISIPVLVTEFVESVEVREIYVQITGEVINPGTYLVPETYTLKDLIYEAGGVTINCDISKINWNITLVLGAHIYIPSYDDEIESVEYSDKININTASLETLISLPGIGDILGQRIIDYRAEFGNFLSIEDIMLVSGIKESIYEQIKDLITV